MAFKLDLIQLVTIFRIVLALPVGLSVSASIPISRCFLLCLLLGIVLSPSISFGRSVVLGILLCVLLHFYSRAKASLYSKSILKYSGRWY